MKQAAFKAKKREGVETPSFGTIGERMGQGGRQSHAAPPRGLDAQMSQGSKGYSHGDPSKKKLREVMGQ